MRTIDADFLKGLDKETASAIRACQWRMDVGGVKVCGGACNICSIEIQRGRCDTLRRFFQEKSREQVDKCE